MRLVWTPEAIEDRHAIFDHIEADNPSAAVKLDALFSEILRVLHSAMQWPRA